MRYLLDTNVVSELRKIGDGKADANVVAWIGAEDASRFFLSATTILELERGVLGYTAETPHKALGCVPGSIVTCVRSSRAVFYQLTMRLRHVAPTCTSPTGAMRPTR